MKMRMHCILGLVCILITFGAISFAASSDVWMSAWTTPSVNKRVVSCWGRSYDYTSGVLPTRIVSQRDNILTGPMEIAASANGSKIRWTDCSFKMLGSDSERVRYSTSALSGDIKAECVCTTEFDGTTRVDMTITPARSLRLDSLDIVVPLKPCYATLFHHSSIYPVWDWEWMKKRMNSGVVKPEGMKLPFVFYIWLGNDDRGLQLFSESDEPWSHADLQSAVTVVPSNGATLLRMNALSNYTLDKPWKWTFGFIATPVKKYPNQYYRTHFCLEGGYGEEKNSYSGKPADKDHPSYLDVLEGQGLRYLGCWERWSDVQSLCRPKESDKSRLKSLVLACRQKGIGLAPYTGCYMATKADEYNPDWDVLPLGDHYQYTRWYSGDICRVACSNSKLPELLLKEYTAAFKEYGFQGLYIDGLTSPVPCCNTKHGCGYIGKDGTLHNTLPIWRSRELIKNLSRLLKSQNPPGILVAHTSGSILLPALSMVDFYNEAEHMGPYRIGSEYFPEDVLRAEMSGHNFGIPATQFPNPTMRYGTDVERERGRTICLLYDSLWFFHTRHQVDIWRAFDSFDMSNVVWIPYWRVNELLESKNATDIKISSYLDKGRGALFVVANLGDKPANAELTVNRRGLGLNDDVSLRSRDEVSGGLDLQTNGDSVSVTVKPGTFRMISVQTAQTRGK
ncbi:MAG: glycoside hydrolase domain-containing protein [Armatimonadota bacterium]